ncbi:MAG: sodium/proton-translocating pyrophosphatase, partial [Planctomycetales bacterium]|nr:sodium/proton-translocating pyrophosphatase [Planctomycetales bacterium]
MESNFERQRGGACRAARKRADIKPGPMRWRTTLLSVVGALAAFATARAQDGAPAEIDTSVITGAWWIAPIASVLALIFAVYFYRKMAEANEGNERMIEIAGHVRDGAMAYLRRQYMVVTAVFVVLLVILFVLAMNGIQNPFVPIAFLTGGFFSGLCGYIGMRTATAASS